MFVRFLLDGNTYYGIEDNGKVTLLEGDLFKGYQKTERVVSLQEITLLPPCTPSKIICVGRNYKAHAEEMNMQSRLNSPSCL